MSDHALSAKDPADIIGELKDRAEVTDALYRFTLGLDLRDRELAASAFAADAELESRATTGKGEPGPVMTGRDTIVETVLATIARLDTTHVVTNPRIQVNGDAARLTAIVEAQHLLTADHSRNALMKNRYTVALCRDGERWVMRRVRVETVWHAGDPAAVFG
ncbi:nuclear transport factor 2 family protein [Pseudofrankia asymbiotica]|uniref:nuclear transport factor 2 family protein n=1 Tax=Pseudofrankia asymbiotica TaxID=1834516 RepID=UPI0018E966D5|nr:nuclear transport factor 2 family protein [Pseudofrankia asymbiotica]